MMMCSTNDVCPLETCSILFFIRDVFCSQFVHSAPFGVCVQDVSILKNVLENQFQMVQVIYKALHFVFLES